jgi:chromosome segregation ATPase
MAKQSVKDLHAQIQHNKELLAKLQPALELKKTRKAALEAELRKLTAEIEADEKKMAELPESTKKNRKEALAALNAARQIKTKLSALSKTQETDQKYVGGYQQNHIRCHQCNLKILGCIIVTNNL